MGDVRCINIYRYIQFTTGCFFYLNNLGINLLDNINVFKTRDNAHYYTAYIIPS